MSDAEIPWIRMFRAEMGREMQICPECHHERGMQHHPRCPYYEKHDENT